ncbi:MAG: anti-sigma factor [Elusimicrobia bacterium]|nr:anti-sigma factor [Elusimicrobiota bacterium]
MEARLTGLFSVGSCRETAARLAAGVLETGGFLERLLLRIHLAICPPCRAFARQLAALSAAARAWSASLASPARLAALEKKLLERLT